MAGYGLQVWGVARRAGYQTPTPGRAGWRPVSYALLARLGVCPVPAAQRWASKRAAATVGAVLAARLGRRVRVVGYQCPHCGCPHCY